MRFKKGSPEAKRYMAKIRAKKGTASVGALPFTGVFDTIKFKAETVADGILFTVGNKKITYKRGNTVTEIGEKIANAIKSQNTDYFYTDSEYNALKRKFSKFAGTLKDQLPKKSTMPKKTAVKSKPVTAKVVATSTQRGKSNIKRDAMLKALPPGKRISKTGRKYTETRKNRSDAPGSMTGTKHKDTKSHNVNIRVVSGVILERSIIQRNNLEKDLNNALNQLEILKMKVKEEKTNKNYKMEAFHRKLLVRYPKYIQSLKKQIRDVNKIILSN